LQHDSRHGGKLSIHQWMGGQRKLFSLEKEGSPVTYDNMDAPE
jgi:hypothetical protein